MSSEPVETLGRLDAVTVRGRDLELRGWLVPLGAARLTGLGLSLERRALSRGTTELGVARPDVVSEYPTLPATEDCGFRVSVPIGEGARERLSDSLLTATPMFGTRAGSALFGVVEPSLVLPTPRDQRAFGDDFLGMAYRLLGHCVNHARLRPDHHVLDVACGAGRLAYALTSYLSPSGRYEGFDANARWVQSAREAIATRRRNFTFRAIDVRNPYYNPDGAVRPTELAFPYPDDTFDVVCAISLFQHMRPAPVRHYLREIARVLRPHGRCLITCFVLGAGRVEADMRAGGLDFLHPLDGSWSADAALPEIGIAHEQPALERWIREAGLAVGAMREGMWRGGSRAFSFQDLLIIEKP